MQTQRERDERAARTLCTLESGKLRRNYFIYLRPFHVSGKLLAFDENDLDTARARMHSTPWVGATPGSEMTTLPLANVRLGIGEDRGGERTNPDLEEILERGVRRYGDLIALGRPSDSVGSGKIATGETIWQRVLMQLGSRACAFIVMPAMNAGTRWEIRWLKQERNFRDCMFLMPGLSPGFDGLEYWTRTTQALKPMIELPRFCGPPALFCFDQHGGAHVVPLASKAVKRANGIVYFAGASDVRRSVRLLLPIARGDDHPARDELVRFARVVAGEIWDKHGLRAWVDGHPARSAQPRIGATTPDLAERPTSFTWHAQSVVALEFRACGPLERVSLVILVRDERGRRSYIGYGLHIDDADPNILEQAHG